MGINVIGNILDSSGYASHTRNLLNSLMKFTKVKLMTQINPGHEMLLSDKELYAYKNNEKYDVNLIITNPIYWRNYSTNKVNLAYLVFEGDKIPLSWIDECLNPEITQIIVPSEHTKQAILNTVSTTNDILNSIVGSEMRNWNINTSNTINLVNKIKVIPHGVNLDLFYPKDKPSKTTFLVNKGWRNMEDRGGTQYAIKAFAEEFKKDEDVEMIVKINPAYGIPDINKLMKEILDKHPDHAPIKVVTDNLDYKKMVDFYNLGNIFISPTRAESFNIPCLEAMACGLPVITTEFGGQTDFVNNNNGWIVSGEKTEVTWELLYEGIKWLTPYTDELRKAMRTAQTDKELLKIKSVEAIKTAQNLTWDNTANLILE